MVLNYRVERPILGLLCRLADVLTLSLCRGSAHADKNCDADRKQTDLCGDAPVNDAGTDTSAI